MQQVFVWIYNLYRPNSFDFTPIKRRLLNGLTEGVTFGGQYTVYVQNMYFDSIVWTGIQLTVISVENQPICDSVYHTFTPELFTLN